MKTVHRVELEVVDHQVVDLPGYMRPLHVAQSRGYDPDASLELWYEADPDDPLSRHCSVAVWVEGTGHPIEHDGQYVGTFPASGGRLIWHVYARQVIGG